MAADRRLYESHAALCAVFTSAPRLEILDLLRGGERTVSELAEETGLRQPNVSQHLALMRQKGVVATRREGTAVFYRVRNPKIFKAFDTIREVLREQLEEEGRMAVAMAKPRGRG